MIKTGAQHIASLKDNRSIYIDGDVVADATTSPYYRNAIASVGKMFDFAHENRALMTFQTEHGDAANRIWQLPHSYEDLKTRRRALEAWTELHGGFLGRAPDHVASCISGMFMGLEVFEAYDKDRAGALADYYRFARDNDLYLTYVIINPQADRSKTTSQQKNEFLSAGVVDRDAEGITLRGAKMLATGGIMANEVFVACLQPLQPGEEKYAFSCAVPMNSKGLKILSRKSYEKDTQGVYDYPMSSRFDENDAVLYFDDVKVPWERVFNLDNVDMCRKQFTDTPAHVYQNYQAMIRLSVKLRFLLGIARRIADMNGIVAIPSVRGTLGELAAQCGMVEAFVYAMEAQGTMHGQYYVPDAHMLYSAQALCQKLYPQIITTIRELAGGGLIMLPSSVKDFGNPELVDLIEKTQQSPAGTSEERVKFFRLAWDALGSEFASRHVQYEMFYSGAAFVTQGHAFRTFDWARSAKQLDDIMGSYDLHSERSRS